MSHPASSHRPRPWGTVGAGIAAVAACAVCCAGPLLAVLGALGAASALASFWVPALAVVAVAAAVGAYVLHHAAPGSRLPYSGGSGRPRPARRRPGPGYRAHALTSAKVCSPGL